jgi:hypothetical protein
MVAPKGRRRLASGFTPWLGSPRTERNPNRAQATARLAACAPSALPGTTPIQSPRQGTGLITSAPSALMMKALKLVSFVIRHFPCRAKLSEVRVEGEKAWPRGRKTGALRDSGLDESRRARRVG